MRGELQSFDTPTVCNALEALAPARRGYGYTTEPLFCARPGLPPVVALARTATIRSEHPSDLAGSAARELSDAYYAYIGRRPEAERRGDSTTWTSAAATAPSGAR